GTMIVRMGCPPVAASRSPVSPHFVDVRQRTPPVPIGTLVPGIRRKDRSRLPGGGSTATGRRGSGMVWNADITRDVVVQAHGEVSATDRSYARTKLARIWQRASAPVLYAKVELRRA